MEFFPTKTIIDLIINIIITIIMIMIVKGDEACVRGAGGEGGRVAHDGQRLRWDASGDHRDHNGRNGHNGHNDHKDNEDQTKSLKTPNLGFWCSSEDGGN